MNRTNRILQLAVITVYVVAVIATTWIGIRGFDIKKLVPILFILWAISPYIPFTLLLRVIKTTRAFLFLFLGIVIIAGGGIYLIVDAMFIHVKAQGTLLYFQIPIYQWILVILLAFLLLKIEKSTPESRK
jgi:hypothetical protein